MSSGNGVAVFPESNRRSVIRDQPQIAECVEIERNNIKYEGYVDRVKSNENIRIMQLNAC